MWILHFWAGQQLPFARLSESPVQSQPCLSLFSWIWNFHTPGSILPIRPTETTGLPAYCPEPKGPHGCPLSMIDTVQQEKALTPAPRGQQQASPYNPRARVTVAGLKSTQGQSNGRTQSWHHQTHWVALPTSIEVTTAHERHQLPQILKPSSDPICNTEALTVTGNRGRSPLVPPSGTPGSVPCPPL